MSRHGRKVPVGFYHRFAKDARAFADKVANGRLISVLEGGYSDRALTSGVMAHTAGLLETAEGVDSVDPAWWSIDNLMTVRRIESLDRTHELMQTAARKVNEETSWRQNVLGRRHSSRSLGAAYIGHFRNDRYQRAGYPACCAPKVNGFA